MKKLFVKKQTSYFLKKQFESFENARFVKTRMVSSGYLANKYSITFNPNSGVMLVYKLITSKGFEFFVNCVLHFVRMSISSVT